MQLTFFLSVHAALLLSIDVAEHFRATVLISHVHCEQNTLHLLTQSQENIQLGWGGGGVDDGLSHLVPQHGVF